MGNGCITGSLRLPIPGPPAFWARPWRFSAKRKRWRRTWHVLIGRAALPRKLPMAHPCQPRSAQLCNSTFGDALPEEPGRRHAMNQHRFDVVVLGAGAAGLMAAMEAGRRG